MQDRFKFRFWDKETQTMQKSPMIELRQRMTLDTIFNDDRVIFMQSTGLKDKNGKLIYEGDIVQTTFENNSKIIFSVVWDNKTALFNGKIIKKEGINNYFMPNWDYLYYLLGNEKDEVEVIGNINENPELIKGEQ